MEFPKGLTSTASSTPKVISISFGLNVDIQCLQLEASYLDTVKIGTYNVFPAYVQKKLPMGGM